MHTDLCHFKNMSDLLVLLVLVSLFSDRSVASYSPPSLSSSYTHVPPELPPMGNCEYLGWIYGFSVRQTHHHLFGQIAGIEAAMHGFQPNPTPLQLVISRTNLICTSDGTRKNRYSSAAALVRYTCVNGPGCGYVGTGEQSHVFFLKCRESDNTWGHYYSELNEPYSVYSDRFSLFITNRDPRQVGGAYLPCSYCYNTDQYVGPIQFHGVTNHFYQCQECYVPCIWIPGNSGCVPTVRDSLTSCCNWFVNNTCLFQCPGPAYTGSQDTSECKERITTRVLSRSNQERLCANDMITFQCSVFQYTLYDNVLWNVSFVGGESIELLFQEGSAIIIERADYGVRGERLPVLSNTITANLQFTILPDVTLAEVSCGYAGLDAQYVRTINIEDIIHHTPFAPQNFRVTGEDVVGVNMIRYVMEWDVIVPGVSYEYNQVEFTVTPEPVSRQKSIVSPMWIIFTTSTEYEVMLRFGNCVGSNSSTLRFVTIPLPNITITDEVSGETTSSDVLNISALFGAVGPHFTCSAQSTPPITLMWTARDSFPSDVLVSSNALAWNRPMSFADAGQYYCTVTNRRGVRTATVNLDVITPPTITSISPSFPCVRNSGLDSYTVSHNHRGLIVSCVTVGSPAPAVEWTKNGQVVSGNAISVSRTEQSRYHMAMLVFIRQFTSEDAGEYSCQARSQGLTAFQEKTIQLRYSETAVYPYQIRCLGDLESDQIFIRIRLLNTNCHQWNRDVESKVTVSMLNILQSIVSTGCEGNCSLENITIMSRPRCSKNVATTAVIFGSITTTNTAETSHIYCILDEWYQKQPLIQLLPGMYYHADNNCSLLVSSLADTECAVVIPYVTAYNPIQYTSFVVGWIMLLLLLAMLTAALTVWACKLLKVVEMQSQGRLYPQSSQADIYTTKWDNKMEHLYRDTTCNVYPEPMLGEVYAEGEMIPDALFENVHYNSMVSDEAYEITKQQIRDEKIRHEKAPSQYDNHDSMDVRSWVQSVAPADEQKKRAKAQRHISVDVNEWSNVIAASTEGEFVSESSENDSEESSESEGHRSGSSIEGSSSEGEEDFEELETSWD